MNAKQELLYALKIPHFDISNKKIKCAAVMLETVPFSDKEPVDKKIALKLDHSDLEYTEFLESLDFEYDQINQEFHGNIWFEDGTWLSKDYDTDLWSGEWIYYRAPSIPVECFPSDF